jgi:membrane protein implicated in regulation of membrane protease activity
MVLFAAVGMVVAGETVLQGRMGDLAFVGYWMVCLVLTALAVLVALLDARALRRRSREESRQLLQATLKEIEANAKTRAGRLDRDRR